MFVECLRTDYRVFTECLRGVYRVLTGCLVRCLHSVYRVLRPSNFFLKCLKEWVRPTLIKIEKKNHQMENKEKAKKKIIRFHGLLRRADGKKVRSLL